MHIVKLTSENIKGVKAVEVEPDGNTVIISGKNGQGKSSVLDSIWYALGGEKNIPAEPIRKGEKRAEITIELDDIIVTRKWTSNEKSYLQVTNKDKEGATYASPQKMLDKLIGMLSFDPLDFVNTDKEKQVKILLDAIKIPPFQEKLESISRIKVTGEGAVNVIFNNVYQVVFDKRTAVNRELKTAKANLEQIVIPKDAEEKETVLLSDLYKRKADMTASVAAREKDIKRMKEIEDKKTELRTEYDNKTKELDTEYAGLEKEVALLPPEDKIKKELDDLQEQIDTADSVNKISEDIKKKKEAEEEFGIKENESKNLTDTLEEIKSYKDELISNAEMPIDGLNFADGAVTYNEIPFDQLSSSEKLKVSLSIAMALNPELKVIRIMDGSLLDKDSMKIVTDMAESKDYQVWIEVVDDSGKLGVYIEDGSVVEKKGE